MEKEFEIKSSGDNKIHELDDKVLYDVIIVGGGPAGLTAAVYCMRKGIKTGLATYNIGGQVIETASIENYMGYRYIEGYELVQKFQEQIRQFDIGFIEGYNAVSVHSEENVKNIKLDNGKVYSAKAVIIATGKSPRKLGVPGETEFTGRGVHYCATCDAPFYKNKNVIVVGGGNSGIEAAIDLSRIAAHVTVIQYEKELTADRVLIKKINDAKNTAYLYSSQITGIKGGSKVTSCIVQNRETNKTKDFVTDGVFVEIGLIPNTGFIKGYIELNEQDEVRVDSLCRTNVEGIFAAGDVTSVKYKQIIIAAGEGSKAALSAYEYILRETK